MYGSKLVFVVRYILPVDATIVPTSPSFISFFAPTVILVLLSIAWAVTVELNVFVPVIVWFVAISTKVFPNVAPKTSVFRFTCPSVTINKSGLKLAIPCVWPDATGRPVYLPPENPAAVINPSGDIPQFPPERLPVKI